MPFQQTQAQALLGIFDIAGNGLLLAVNFFNPKVAKSGNDSRQKQNDRKKRPEGDEAVLPGR